MGNDSAESHKNDYNDSRVATVRCEEGLGDLGLPSRRENKSRWVYRALKGVTGAMRTMPLALLRTQLMETALEESREKF